MAKTTTTVTGLADLERRLNLLSADIAGKVSRGATAAGARVIQADAKRRAPVLTGAGKAGIVTKRITGSRLTAEYDVGYRKAKKADRNGPKDGWYMRLVELGTVKMAAQPHLRPAFDSKKEAAVDKMAEVLKRRLDKAGV